MSMMIDPSPIASNHCRRHEDRRPSSGHRRRRDHDIGVGDFAQQRRPAGRDALRRSGSRAYPPAASAVTASLTKTAPAEFGLFFRGGAHVVGADLGAEALGRRDGLQPRHADAHHQDPGGPNGARRRRQKWEKSGQSSAPQRGPLGTPRPSPATRGRPCTGRAKCAAAGRRRAR